MNQATEMKVPSPVTETPQGILLKHVSPYGTRVSKAQTPQIIHHMKPTDQQNVPSTALQNKSCQLP